MSAPSNGDLRAWWCPTIPGQPFHVLVPSLVSARLTQNTLADYDLFLTGRGLLADFANAGGVEVFEDGEWSEYTNDDGYELEAMTDAEIAALDLKRTEASR